MLWAGNRNRHRVLTLNRMAANTLFEAVLFFADTFVHGFITLVHQQVHVIAAHKPGVFDTLVTFAQGDYRHRHTAVVDGRRLFGCGGNDGETDHIDQYDHEHRN